MTMDLAIARRESVQAIPGLDGVIGTGTNPFDRREFSWGFRVVTKGGADAAHDLLMAALLRDRPVRLVYKTDSGALWFNTGHLLHTEEQWGVDHPYYFDFRATWRIRPDWRARYSEAADVWGVSDGIWGTNDGVWGQGFFIQLLSSYVTPTGATQPFTIDATGVVGTNLPTIDDTGPVIRLTTPGPTLGIGGPNGIRIQNGTATYVDEDGHLQPTIIELPFPLGGNSGATLDCGKRSFVANGPTFRPRKGTPAQPWWWKVKAGVVNQCAVVCLDSSATFANSHLTGRLSVDWIRKRG